MIFPQIDEIQQNSIQILLERVVFKLLPDLIHQRHRVQRGCLEGFRTRGQNLLQVVNLRFVRHLAVEPLEHFRAQKQHRPHDQQNHAQNNDQEGHWQGWLKPPEEPPFSNQQCGKHSPCERERKESFQNSVDSLHWFDFLVNWKGCSRGSFALMRIRSPGFRTGAAARACP